MYDPAAVIENDTHKLVWDFDIQTDHQILARRPHLIITIKKRICCPGWPQNKTERMWKEG